MIQLGHQSGAALLFLPPTGDILRNADKRYDLTRGVEVALPGDALIGPFDANPELWPGFCDEMRAA